MKSQIKLGALLILLFAFAGIAEARKPRPVSSETTLQDLRSRVGVCEAKVVRLVAEMKACYRAYFGTAGSNSDLLQELTQDYSRGVIPYFELTLQQGGGDLSIEQLEKRFEGCSKAFDSAYHLSVFFSPFACKDADAAFVAYGGKLEDCEQSPNYQLIPLVLAPRAGDSRPYKPIEIPASGTPRTSPDSSAGTT